MPKFAVFDVDGTLVDSRRSIAAAMAQAFEALDLASPTYEETRRIVGLSLAPAIKVLAPDLPEHRYAALAEAYKSAFIANRAAGLVEPLYDGAFETLTRLREDGWTLGVATGKARRGVDVFLANHGLADFFACAFCADDGPGKPDPHMLRLNMDATRRLPHDTIMIGDTSFDMQMARAAGCTAQGVAWGFHTIDEVRAGGAHHVALTFADLAEELSAFAGR